MELYHLESDFAERFDAVAEYAEFLAQMRDALATQQTGSSAAVTQR